MSVPEGSPGPRAEAVVDLDAVRHNVSCSPGALRPGAATMAVVKADGYGHGAAAVGRAALSAGAGWLGVATLEEALDLRGAGITAPVLCWLHVPDEEFAPAVAADVDLSVSSREHLAAVLAGAARRAPGAAAPQGGHRPRAQRGAAVGVARPGGRRGGRRGQGRAEIVAVWSHLAQADEPAHPTQDVQAAALAEAVQAVRARGVDPIRHLANSAATMTRPDLHWTSCARASPSTGWTRSPSRTPARCGPR